MEAGWKQRLYSIYTHLRHKHLETTVTPVPPNRNSLKRVVTGGDYLFQLVVLLLMHRISCWHWPLIDLTGRLRQHNGFSRHYSLKESPTNENKCVSTTLLRTKNSRRNANIPLLVHQARKKAAKWVMLCYVSRSVVPIFIIIWRSSISLLNQVSH